MNARERYNIMRREASVVHGITRAERMMQVARRKRNDRRVLGQLVRELQELELPETQYRQVREQITEIFEGER